MNLLDFSLRRMICLVGLLFASLTFVQAQQSEIGIQLKSFDLFRSSELENNPFNPSDRDNGFNTGIYLQKNLDKFYLRYNANVNGRSSLQQYTATDGTYEIDVENKISYFNSTIGIEIGKNIELGKRFRLQVGAGLNLAKVWTDRGFKIEPIVINGSYTGGYDEITRTSPRPFRIIPLLVMRADYQVSNRVRIGFGLDWGYTLLIARGDSESTVREFDSNNQFVGESKVVISESLTSIYARGLSKPFLNIGFNLGK